MIDIGRPAVFEITVDSVFWQVIEGIKPGVVHTGRFQDMLLDEIAVEHAGLFVDQHPQKDISAIGIGESLAGGKLQRFTLEQGEIV